LGEIRNAYKILVRKSEGMNPLDRPGVYERKILIWIFKKEGMDWIQLARDRDR
jgi:hypothetical protein